LFIIFIKFCDADYNTFKTLKITRVLNVVIYKAVSNALCYLDLPEKIKLE